ncbi:cytochrome P450 [Diplocarpon mali]|nr:cytochrome P450 [Diplocarpon mali]
MALLSQLSPSSILGTLLLLVSAPLVDPRSDSPLQLLARVAITSLRRLLFHPLSSIPGPFSNALSELPATLALVSGNQHVYYRALHERYGPVVRVSPDEVSFVSVEARDEIYGFRAGDVDGQLQKGRALMEKSPIFLGAVGKVDGCTGVSLALDAEHTRQRRALGYLFTNSALLQEEHLLHVHVRKLMDVFEKAAVESRALDFSSWCMSLRPVVLWPCFSGGREGRTMDETEAELVTYVAFDVMGDLCFSSPFGCLSQASSTEWSTSVINVFVAATWTQGIRRLSGVGTYFETLLTYLFIPSAAAKWRTTHLSNARAATRRRLANGDHSHPDFISQILSNSSSKKELTPTEIELNMALFISAGTDTTATTLTGWTWYICAHPLIYRRLTQEVRDAFESEEEIGWESVRKLRLLEATLLEALRLFPPSAASQQRIVSAGGATIDGFFIPGGKTVAVSPWASTRSHLNFHRPDDFIPDRWLDEGKEDKLAASVPFGNGPRVCVGRNLALMEMLIITASLLWRFEVEVCAGEFEERNARWGELDSGRMRAQKVFHSMTKPALWVRLEKVRRRASEGSTMER